MPDSDNVNIIRGTFRKDLTTVGMIPTALGIELAAKDDPSLRIGLYCEAVYVQMYNGRSKEQILAYLTGPLQVSDRAALANTMRTVMRVRTALSKYNGDQRAAYSEIVGKNWADREVAQKIIEACVRTAKEFNIPWSKTYFPEMQPRKSLNLLGCLVLLAIVLIVIFLIYKLIHH